MNTRSIKRWSISFGLVVVALLFTTLAVTLPRALADTSNIINCPGPIQPCINSALNGDTIVIAPGTYTESLTLNKPVSLTGQSSATTIIHALTNQRVLTVSGATIDSSVVISGLSFTAGNVSGGSVCPDNCGGGILVNNSAQPWVQNIVISASRAYYGGGLYSDGSLTITNITVFSNTATSNGGGMSIAFPRVFNSRFERNVAGGGGGLAGTSLMVNNSDFVNNFGDFGGGGAFADVIRVTGSRFQSNMSNGDGGALEGTTISVTNTDFISNTTTSFGEGGGAIHSGLTPVRVTGGLFERNSAPNANGGALRVSGLRMNGATFISNTARSGGAIYTQYEAYLTDGLLQGNQATLSFGGAMRIGDQLLISRTQFIDNNAATFGGAIFQLGQFDPQSSIVNALFARNHAGTSAAALRLLSGSLSKMEIVHTSIADTSLNPNEAIVASSATVYITNTIVTNHTTAISATSGSVTQDYNLFFGNTITAVGTIVNGSHSLSGNPLFVDLAHDNYHLGLGSSAIDKGTDAGITADIDGDTRPFGMGFDIGYDEFTLDLPNKLYLPLIQRN